MPSKTGLHLRDKRVRHIALTLFFLVVLGNAARAESYCAVQNRYDKAAIAKYVEARALPPNQARRMRDEAERLIWKSETDPDTGHDWDLHVGSSAECDSETTEAIAAASLFEEDDSVSQSELNASTFVASLAEFAFPNRYVTSDVFKDILVNGINKIRQNHEVIYKQFVNESHPADNYKDFFIRWLGSVPTDIFPY